MKGKEAILHLVTIVLACGLALAAFFAERVNNESHATASRGAVQSELGLIRARLEGNLLGDIQLVRGLTGVILVDPDLTQSRFEQAVRPLFIGDTRLHNIDWAPDMVIRLMYPLEGNEKAIGLDFRKTPAQLKTAEQAYSTRRIVLAGPLDLAQGGAGLVASMAVFQPGANGRDIFLGLVSSVLDLETLYRQSGLLASNLPIEIAIRGKDASGPEGEVFFGRAGLFNEAPVVADIPLPSGSWRIAAVPRGGWPLKADNAWWLRLTFLLVALLVLAPFLALGRAMRAATIAQAQAESVQIRLSATLENTPNIAVQWYDGEGHVLYWNHASELIFGWTAAEAIGKTLDQLFDTVSGAREFAAVLANLEANGGTIGPTESVTHHRDGSPRWVSSTVFKIPGETPSLFACVDVDISARKAVEEARRTSESLFRSLVEASPLSVAVVKGPEQKLIVLNRRAIKTFGYSLEDLPDVSHWWRLAYPNADYRDDVKSEWYRRLSVARETDTVMVTESVVTCKDGTRKPTEIHASFTGEFGIMVLSDLTQKKVVEAELLRGKRAAEEANLAKSTFLASMSHELRTPLNSIIGFAQLLDMQAVAPLDPSQEEAVGHILGSSRHLLGLLNELLDFARIESGQIHLVVASMALYPLIGEAVALTRPAAQLRQIAIRHDCRTAMTVSADATRVRQILLNLLSNAVKYNRDGGSVDVSCVTDSDLVRIIVSDTGPGIAEEHRARLFQPFERLDAEHTNIEGTGIGLVICKKLAAAMGGDIGFDSEPGVGSRFWMELPLDHSATRDLARPDVALPEAATAGSPSVRGRVIYVEDNPVNVSVMQHIFRHLPGIGLLITEDAENCLIMIQQTRPDLVLMDINLPGMNGLEALRILKSDPETATIPVIAVSAAAMPRDVRAGLEAGFAGYLTKPFDVAALLSQVKTILQTNEPRQTVHRAIDQ